MSVDSIASIKSLVESHCQSNDGVINKADFDVFHFSVTQKLWETDYYFKEIVNFDERKFLVTATETLTSGDEKTLPTGQSAYIPLNHKEILKHYSMLLSGYFTSAYSVFDSLANEINTLYCLMPQDKAEVQWSTVTNELKQKQKKIQSTLNARIYKLNASRWWGKVQDYRHSISHETVIMPKLDISSTLMAESDKIQSIYLPDNPKKRPFTYKNKLESKGFITGINVKINPAIFDIYGGMVADYLKYKNLPIKNV